MRKRIKWTNDLIDQSLKDNNRSIRRIGNYKDSQIVMEFECISGNDHQHWFARWHDILKGRGCPQCGRKKTSDARRLSLKEVLERFTNAGFELLGEYKNNSTPVLTKHKVCGTERKITPHCIFDDGNCSFCDGTLPLTDDQIRERFIKAGFELLGEYKNNRTPVLIRHNICSNEWLVISDNIFGGSGCPFCANRRKLSNETFDQKLKDNNRPIERIGNYVNSKTPIELKCLTDATHLHWFAKPDNVLHQHQTGCPQCSQNKNEKLIGQLLVNAQFIVNVHKCIRYLDKAGDKKWLFLDYYLPELNAVIEYNGAQHYCPVRFGSMDQKDAEQKLLKQQTRDRILSQYCFDNDMVLIWIDGRKYKSLKLEEYVVKELIPQLREIKSGKLALDKTMSCARL